jgi:phospholipase/lecithinase/hemolysin
MKNFRLWGLTAVAAVVLGACGGGGSDTTPRTSISSVTVMGDSLADVGTFGLKFTVGGAAADTYLIYPERIAQSYGIETLCPYFVATSSTTFAPNPTAGCTDYAIGGGRINDFKAPTSPLSVVVQLETAGAAGYDDSDLLVIDGGGNDAADLVKGFLTANTDGGAGLAAVLTSMPTRLDPAVVAAKLQAQAYAEVGGLYMTALADMFHDAIQANALDKGATHVAVLNMPGITRTPQFQGVLAQVQQSVGADTRAAYEAMFDGWIQAFNAELAASFAGNANVVVVDFYTSFNDEVAHPDQYGLSNATTPTCPSDFPTPCLDTDLSAAPPAGVTDPDWWKTYAFADSFHPTPYGHQLLAQLIAKSLAAAGWL